MGGNAMYGAIDVREPLSPPDLFPPLCCSYTSSLILIKETVSGWEPLKTAS